MLLNAVLSGRQVHVLAFTDGLFHQVGPSVNLGPTLGTPGPNNERQVLKKLLRDDFLPPPYDIFARARDYFHREEAYTLVVPTHFRACNVVQSANMAVFFQPQPNESAEKHRKIANIEVKPPAVMNVPPETIGRLDKPTTPSVPYTSLTDREAEHFLTHGWLKVEGGFEKKYIDEWLPDFWVRSGYEEHDKTTWKEEYLHVAHHRQVRNEKFCPKAWSKIIDICGGEDKIHETRERWVGDNFIVNFGSEARSKEDPAMHPPQTKDKGFHYDNDWYRAFLDSSSTAMTIVHCFTDIPKDGGGTVLCEDALKGVCEKLYSHSDGFDPIFESSALCNHVKHCHDFITIEAKAGDTFLLHGLLPHCNNFNYKHYARVITNPHVTLKEPYKLSRGPGDGDYSLLEQVILRALGRTSIPEYQPSRPLMFWYPRNSAFKLNRVDQELARLKANRTSRGLPESSIESVYLQGDEAINDFIKHNGYDLPFNEELGLELQQHAA